MLSGDAMAGPFGPYLWSFGRVGEPAHSDRIDEIRSTVMHQAGHLW